MQKDVSVFQKYAAELTALGGGGTAMGVTKADPGSLFDVHVFGTLMTWGELVAITGAIAGIGGVTIGALKLILDHQYRKVDKDD